MRPLKIPMRARYRKRIGRFKGIDVKHDQSVLDFSVAASCYNYDFSSGALRGGYGIRSHPSVPQNAKRYWVFKYYNDSAGRNVEQYIYQLPNGMLRYYDSFTGEEKYLSGFSYAAADAINYKLNSKDVMLISCVGRHLITWDGKYMTEHEATPVISSMALHYERLFVLSPDDPTKVFFSDDLDPTNWAIEENAGGFIELLDERGELTKVVSFSNYLYIFREHGISRVSASGGQSEFAVQNLFVSAGRIYPSSIVKCGGAIMFMASDGLYRFDGYECSRVLSVLDGLISGEAGAVAYFDGKYYLSCRMSFNDGRTVGCEAGEHVRNGLLVYDVMSGEYSVTRGLDIDFMSVNTFDGLDFLMAADSAGSGVITRCGRRFDAPLEKHWQSPESDLGTPDKTKAVRELYVDTDVPCSVRIIGRREKTADVRPGARRLRINANEKRLALAVDTFADECNIRPPTLVYSSY